MPSPALLQLYGVCAIASRPMEATMGTIIMAKMIPEASRPEL